MVQRFRRRPASIARHSPSGSAVVPPGGFVGGVSAVAQPGFGGFVGGVSAAALPGGFVGGVSAAALPGGFVGGVSAAAPPGGFW